MQNNDILRRIRYVFDISDWKMIEIFGLADRVVTREEVSDWLKKEDDPAHKKCNDVLLATFLNGLISDRRGKREGPPPKPEKRLTNNAILMKLKIALNLRTEEVMALLELAGMNIGKPELNAFFRRSTHKHYRECKDQVLRNFLRALQLKYRPASETQPDTNKPVEN